MIQTLSDPLLVVFVSPGGFRLYTLLFSVTVLELNIEVMSFTS